MTAESTLLSNSLFFQVRNSLQTCTGTKYRDSCDVNCVEGYEKRNPLTGEYLCLESGQWIGNETFCDPKDCGSPHKVCYAV